MFVYYSLEVIAYIFTGPLIECKSTNKPEAFNQQLQQKGLGKNTLLSVKQVAFTLARLLAFGNETHLAP